MTNEERHIAVLNRMLESMDVYDSIQPTTERKKAIKAAIKALEQQPSDTVSRGAYEQVMWERDVAIGQLKELGYGLGQKVEPCDAISRNMALEKMADYVASGYADSAEDFEEYSRIICQLPSVTQKLETVTEFADRCRECGKMRKGHWIWNFDKGYCKCSECGIGMGHKEFDYCPNCGAKMQESEEV